jgi:hypothetical protein
MSRHRSSSACSLHTLFLASIAFVLIHLLPVLSCHAAEVRRDLVVDFSGYAGGSVDDWLSAKHFTFERDTENRRLLQLSIANDTLTLEAKANMSGFLLNDAVNVEKVAKIRINWGVSNTLSTFPTIARSTTRP